MYPNVVQREFQVIWRNFGHYWVTNCSTEPFFEDFSSGFLDPLKWRVAKQAWGECFDGLQCKLYSVLEWILRCFSQPADGGVVPELVSIEKGPTGVNYLRLEVHGTQYSGDIAGVWPESGRRRTDVDKGKRFHTDTNLMQICFIWEIIPTYVVCKTRILTTVSRVGSAIATFNYYAAGRYEVRAKLTRFPKGNINGVGAANMFW